MPDPTSSALCGRHFRKSSGVPRLPTSLFSTYQKQNGSVSASSTLPVIHFCTGVYRFLKELNAEERQHPAIQHALAVRRALAAYNYHALFQLYIHAVNMAAYMMDNFMERERVAALRTLCKSYVCVTHFSLFPIDEISYRPSLEVAFIAKELGFKNEKQCRKFMDTIVTDSELEVFSVYTDSSRSMLDCKAAFPVFHASVEKYGKVDIKGQI